jgi:hypothetical protein
VGFRDDVRRRSELQQANPQLSRRELQQMLETEKQQSRNNRHSHYFAAAADRPYVEVVPHKIWKPDLNAFVMTTSASLACSLKTRSGSTRSPGARSPAR